MSIRLRYSAWRLLSLLLPSQSCGGACALVRPCSRFSWAPRSGRARDASGHSGCISSSKCSTVRRVPGRLPSYRTAPKEPIRSVALRESRLKASARSRSSRSVSMQMRIFPVMATGCRFRESFHRQATAVRNIAGSMGLARRFRRTAFRSSKRAALRARLPACATRRSTCSTRSIPPGWRLVCSRRFCADGADRSMMRCIERSRYAGWRTWLR